MSIFVCNQDDRTYDSLDVGLLASESVFGHLRKINIRVVDLSNRFLFLSKLQSPKTLK
jgi:hypothetical protein